MLPRLLLLSLLSLLPLTTLGADASQLKLSAAQRQALGIEVAAVNANADTAVSVTAKVVLPPQSIRVVAAPAAGLLTSLQHQAGTAVKSGEKLATLVSPEVVEAQRQYLQAKLKQQLAAENAARDQRLADQGLLAKNTWLLTQNELKQAQADLDAAASSLRLLGVKPEQSGSEIVLTSPMNGWILETLVEPGQRVQAADALVKVADLQQLGLEIPLTPPQAANVKLGQSVNLADNPALQARISRIQPAVDAAQNVVVYADLQQSALTLHPGQNVSVQLQTAHSGDSVSVPRSALAWLSEQAYVFVETPEGFTPTKVQVLAQGEQHVSVSGLSTDAKVATQGVAALKAQWQGE